MFTIDLSGYRDQILVLAAVSVETLLLLPLFLDYRRLRRRKQMEQMSCRRIFGRFLNMLHDAGRLTGCQGTEEDFPARLAREIPSMTPEEADRLTEIVRRALTEKKLLPGRKGICPRSLSADCRSALRGAQRNEKAVVSISESILEATVQLSERLLSEFGD